MSAEESEEQTEQQEEEEQEEELTVEALRPQFYRMVYNNPTILLTMFEVLFGLLEARGVMKPGDADALMREALRSWRDGLGTG